ncbi:hypothetical protein GTZ97_03715 [Aquabacterium fontiphilum]|uniref:hypothetical protein n=1 Tax=Aquabacterium fontiphilum TaxID=450365 RepID=UPI0013777E04|nr:hypothetical protein [Aquabacterium fontiphilum]NBD19778.1 hypothetical protein [Aquabacterium fontiphilum]
MFAVPLIFAWRMGVPGLCVVAGALISVAVPFGANATTAAERRLLAIEAPHEAVVSGTKMRAHWVRQIIFPGDAKSREGALELKRQYEECARTASPRATVKPVQEWPERSAFSIKDFYLAEGVFVEYGYSVSYMVGPTADFGCQLAEVTQFEARGRLLSEKGLCSFDLSSKKADGECRAQLAKASSTPAARARRIVPARNPAMPGAVLGLFSVTEEVKRVNRVPCRVVKARFGESSISHCFAQMGTFKGFHAGAPRPDDTIALSLEDVHEDASGVYFEGRALKAVPDMLISAAVFFPFLNGGFDISESSSFSGGFYSDDEGPDEVAE